MTDRSSKLKSRFEDFVSTTAGKAVVIAAAVLIFAGLVFGAVKWVQALQVSYERQRDEILEMFVEEGATAEEESTDAGE